MKRELKAWMKDMDFSPAQAAEFLKIDRSYISLMLNGKGPGPHLAIKIEKLTKIPRAILRPDLFGKP